MVTPNCNEGGNEIVFFDVETTVPVRTGQRFWVLEFGAILVCPRKLVELESYCTLIRPGDLSAVALTSGRSDGITRSAVATAPTFEDVADRIYTILNGTDYINLWGLNYISTSHLNLKVKMVNLNLYCRV